MSEQASQLFMETMTIKEIVDTFMETNGKPLVFDLTKKKAFEKLLIGDKKQ